MAVNNKFTITYGDQEVGGSSDTYQLHGPYIIDKTYDILRLVFDVAVVGDSYATFHALCDTIETAFRKRDQTLIIDIDGTLWTYTFGSNLLNSTAEIAKSGDPQSDRGVSRVYTVTITADLPAEEATNNGLRDLEVNVNYEPSRQKTVTMRGVYTAVAGPVLATAQYQHAANGFDPVAATLLTGIDSGATFELVDEEYTHDRNDHTCSFTRQYAELLANQSASLLDDPDIRDHSIVFTDSAQHPGDSSPDIFRLRRVVGVFDCSIDIEVTTNLQTVFETKIRPHLVALFQTEFSPSVFCIEDRRVGYDETAKRLSATLQFLYQPSGGSDVVEMSQSLAYREGRTIDYTPVHDQGELSANADPGFAVVERISTRTVVVVGGLSPKRRIGTDSGGQSKPITEFDGNISSGASINSSGWNIVANTSQASRKYVGDPTNESQMLLTMLTETVIERMHTRPGGGGGSNYTPGSTRRPTYNP